MTTDLAKVEKPDAAPLVRFGRPLLTVESLVEEGQQRQLLMKYVSAHMVEGTDFGVIPGTKNRTLLKPGAEKLTDLFRCTTEFEIVRCVEDWDKPLIHYVFRCRIVSRETGGVVAEGFGSCNSHESKYRYRNDSRKCPECGQATILKSKYPPKNNKNAPPGFYCYAAKGGCGAEFAHDDPKIVGQQLGKVENPDVADVANTLLKMAKKRAHVDAAIALARCSDMFTQDAEDMAGGSDYDRPSEPQPAAKPAPIEFKTAAELYAKCMKSKAPTAETLGGYVEWADGELLKLASGHLIGDLAAELRQLLKLPPDAPVPYLSLSPKQVEIGWNHVKQLVKRFADATAAK